MRRRLPRRLKFMEMRFRDFFTWNFLNSPCDASGESTSTQKRKKKKRKKSNFLGKGNKTDVEITLPDFN